MIHAKKNKRLICLFISELIFPYEFLLSFYAQI